VLIDADTHVDECVETWSYFPKSQSDFRPSEMSYIDGQEPPFLKDRPTNGWFIDGQVYPRRIRSDEMTGTTIGTRELYDIPERLKHMDRLNIDVQVVYPTALLNEVTRRPEVEVPICESYNRWLADRTADSNGRIRWVATLPLRSIPDALREMRRAKDSGAVAIFKRAFECDERRAGDAYFFPVYQLAEELDLPICIHVGRPYTGNMGEWSPTQHGIHISGFTQDAFLSLLMAKVPSRFPGLRFGFIEAGAGWLPYVLWIAMGAANTNKSSGQSRVNYEQVLAESHFFTTCELSEDLPSIINAVGDGSLCVGTDYVHNDPHFDLSIFSELFAREDVSKLSAERIAGTNAQQLYGIT
jgi:predicted TIM-barrel fold metal-dependent hydrolase